MLISNSAQFEMVLNLSLQEALRRTMKRLLDELKEIIDREVYSYPNPNGDWDGRTGQFGESWDSTEPQLLDGWMQSTLSNENFNFVWNNERNMWSHGNYNQPLASAEDLDEIINNRQGGSDFGFPALKRNYWGEFTIFCDLNIEKIFVEECIQLGIPIERTLLWSTIG